jgi:hypothetical protein
MGVGDVVEGEGSRDRGPQRPVGEAVADEALRRSKLGVVPREIGEGEPANGEVAREDIEGRHRRRVGRERAVEDQRAAIRSRPRELRESGPTDRIEDQIGAFVVGQALDLGDNFLLGGRDDRRRATAEERISFSRCACQRNGTCVQAVGDLDRGETNTARSSGDQTVCPAASVPMATSPPQAVP